MISGLRKREAAHQKVLQCVIGNITALPPTVIGTRIQREESDRLTSRSLRARSAVAEPRIDTSRQTLARERGSKRPDRGGRRGTERTAHRLRCRPERSACPRAQRRACPRAQRRARPRAQRREGPALTNGGKVQVLRSLPFAALRASAPSGRQHPLRSPLCPSPFLRALRGPVF
jgi:hypothetical protein